MQLWQDFSYNFFKSYDKCEYLTGQNISPSSQHPLINQQESLKFFHWVQQFSKQTKGTAE